MRPHPHHRMRPAQLIFSGELGPASGNLAGAHPSELFDRRLVAVLSLPIMLVVAIAVKLLSAGPILYRQTRVGKDGVPFTLYKFRSMRSDAEQGTVRSGRSRTIPASRRAGNLLRKLRLDELPQLFNVLRGEMSIVGPRPERPEFVQTLSNRSPTSGSAIA